MNFKINKLKRRIGTVALSLGIDPRRLAASLLYLPTFLKQAVKVIIKSHNKHDNFNLHWVPVLSDRYMPGGTAKGHYFHQDLWAARKIYQARPKEHVDIGSRIDGFIAHLLSFRTVTVLDVRPLQAKVTGLKFLQADFMSDAGIDLSVDSVSCLHALEHFGLGRYGDPFDIDGWKKGFKNLAKILSQEGFLYLSVPIGVEQCIEFNAQRIFSPDTLPIFANELGLQLIEFSYINDAGDFFENANHIGLNCDFGCGCYIFKKIRS